MAAAQAAAAAATGLSSEAADGPIAMASAKREVAASCRNVPAVTYFPLAGTGPPTTRPTLMGLPRAPFFQTSTPPPPSVLCTVVSTFEKLITVDRDGKMSRLLNDKPPDIDANIIPDYYSLGVGHAHRNGEKAFWEDLRRGEVYKWYLEEMADIYLPLAVKSKLKCDIPVSFKGGQLHDLFKDNGEPDIPEH